VYPICGVINLAKKESNNFEERDMNIWDYLRIAFFAILFIILIPLFILGAVILVVMGLLFHKYWNRCDHWRECPWYNPRDGTCMEYGGFFYDYDRPAGCYRTMQDKKETLKKKGKALKRIR